VSGERGVLFFNKREVNWGGHFELFSSVACLWILLFGKGKE
jgi:hypothetical protein